MDKEDNNDSGSKHFKKVIGANVAIGEKNDFTIDNPEKEILNKLAKSQRRIIFIINHQTQKYVFLSDNVYEIINISRKKLWENGYNLLIKSVAVNDQLYIARLLEYGFNFINENFTTNEILDLSYTFTYRLIDDKGESLQALQRGNILKINESKQPVIESGMLININHWKKTDHLLFFIKSGKKSLLLLHRSGENEVKELKLSYAQLKVLKCFAKGYNSNQTALELKISKYTVDTHRKNILSKTGFSDTNALIHFAKEAGII